MKTLTTKEMWGDNHYRQEETMKDNFRVLREGGVKVTVDGTTYRGIKGLSGRDLAKGQIVAAMYDRYNTGLEFFEVMGVTGNETKYGRGSVKYDSVKDAMKDTGCKSLKELEGHTGDECGQSHYLWLRNLEYDPDDRYERDGPWGYLFKGRWSRGSGAEPWSWVLLEEVDREADLAEADKLDIAAGSLRKQQEYQNEKIQELEDRIKEMRWEAHLTAIKASRLKKKARELRE